jgi:hypothetical protein
VDSSDKRVIGAWRDLPQPGHGPAHVPGLVHVQRAQKHQPGIGRARGLRRGQPARAAAVPPAAALRPTLRSAPAAGARLARTTAGQPVAEEVQRLGGTEPQILGPQLGHVPAYSQPAERQRRVGPGNEDQVQLGRGTVQKQAVGDLGRLYQEQFDLEILYPVEQSVQVPLVPDIAGK